MKIIVSKSQIVDKIDDIVELNKLLSLANIQTQRIYQFQSGKDAYKFIKKYPKKYEVISQNFVISSNENNSSDLEELLISIENSVIIRPAIKGVNCNLISFSNGIQFSSTIILEIDDYIYIGLNNCRIYLDTAKKLEPYFKNKFIGIFKLVLIINTSGCYIKSFNTNITENISNLIGINNLIKYFNGKEELHIVQNYTQKSSGYKNYKWIKGQHFI